LQKRRENYRNVEIIYSLPIDEQDQDMGNVHITINGKPLHAMRSSDGSYATHFLPFKNYESIQGLARDVAEKVPYFMNDSPK
jgi:hypothetical protein